MEYILGVVASLVVQAIKKYLGTDSFATQALVLMIVFCVSASWVIFQDTAVWETFLKVLVTAGAVHNFVIRKFE